MLAKECAQLCCDDPIDERVVRKISERYPLDANYLEFVSSCHGAEPENVAVNVGDRTVSVAKFLTLLDFESELLKPLRPHFNHDADERVIDSVDFFLGGENSTSRGLFSRLVPFAATEAENCLDRCYVDLFCFDYRKKVEPVEVVLWNASRALDQIFLHEKLPMDEAFDDEGNFNNVDWGSFVEPVAPSFEQFTEILFKTPK